MADELNRVRGVMSAPQDVTLPEAMGATPIDDRDPADFDPYQDQVPDYDPEPWAGLPPPIDPDLPPPPEQACSLFPLNDYGNGLRFIRHFGEGLIYEPKLGWHVWTGTHYAVDRHQLEVRKKAQQLGELIDREVPYIRLPQDQMDLIATEPDLKIQLEAALAMRDDDGKQTAEGKELTAQIGASLSVITDLKGKLSTRRKAHRSFAKSSGNRGKIDAAMTEAQPQLAVDFDSLDADPMVVNCQSGLLKFTLYPASGGDPRQATVKLEPHDRSQLVTKIVDANFDRRAKCPQFMAFLERIQPQAEIREFLQRWFGLSMSGIPAQALTFFYGAGANGKSVLVELIAKLLGEYAADIRIETLTGRNSASGASATPDLVYLVGARMARASEPKEGEPLQDGLVKSITSGEPIMVRPNFGDFFRFYPVFKMVISGNHKPDIRSTDDGIWRRINLVPFNVQIPENERDPDLGAKLWAERDGILQWLCDGFIDYLEGGLQVPRQVREATAEYREDSDPIGTFVTHCCECTGDAADRITSRELMLAFNWYLDGRGEGRWTERRVSMRLKDKAGRWKSPKDGRGYEILKSAGVMVYTGIRFTAEFAERLGAAPRDHEGRPLTGRAADDL